MSREGRYVATVWNVVATMSQPSMAHSGQWTEPLALIRALPNCWQCYFRLRPLGQPKLLKIVPDDFFFKKQGSDRGKNVIMSQVFCQTLAA